MLVGGGHAHVQVLRRWAMAPPANTRVMVVLDRAVAVYSGMVPGFVAGDYAMHELEIDVVPLARRAGAGVILSAARDLDPIRRELLFEDRPAIRFDLASLDVGSTVRGLALPGVAEHALSTRPIGHFVRQVDGRLARLGHAGRTPRILIVGGGAAGSELAFTLDGRLRAKGVEPSIAIVSGSTELLDGMPARARRRLAREAVRRGIEHLARRRVIQVEPGGVVAERLDAADDRRETESLEADLVVWATGAAPLPFPLGQTEARLDRDDRGFLAIRDTLQTVGHDAVFAVGDCARLVDHPWVPRAGVYAVRQGPVLERNLRAWLAGEALERYVPQRDFLALLHLGQGRALASKWGLAAAGRPWLWLKDRIDRRFMSRFQVLDSEGRPRPELAELGAMAPEDDAKPMPCGGCAAKLPAAPLAAALDSLPPAPPDETVLLGVEARRDVGASRDAEGRTTLHNIDVIRAFCDDPWLVGRVAALNALSDLLVTGGRPRHAQAVIGLPEIDLDLAEELLRQALLGIRSVLDASDVSLLGGHTTSGDALMVGLALTGDGPDPETLLARASPRAGDEILLTRPLGTGVVLAADMQGRARGEWVEAAHASMTRDPQPIRQLVLLPGVHAATDVTGFGLAGHLLSLLRGEALCARLDADAIELLPGADRLWRDGLRSTAHAANQAAFGPRVRGASTFDEAWLFDPQTAGGCLLALAPDRSAACLAAFESAGEPRPACIGRLVEATGESPTRGPQIEIRPRPERPAATATATATSPSSAGDPALASGSISRAAPATLRRQ